MDKHPLDIQYRDLLVLYMDSKEEGYLYAGQQLSKWMMEHQISPEEIVSYHIAAIKDAKPDTSEEMVNASQFLLEVMIGYGIAYREHQSLRSKQDQLESEIKLAMGVQQSLLPDTPQLEEVEIGVVSVPASQMSGDYYNFLFQGKYELGIAIADIIGKGIPAAMSMSMIKYAMDSLQSHRLSPSEMLSNLNGVVEKNIGSSMFISMLYGNYHMKHHTLSYSSAGHEPGLFYNAKENQFTDLVSKGLLLGVSKEVEYDEYQVHLLPGDMVVLFSDGVTECKIDNQFLEREGLIDLLHTTLHLPAQDIVDTVYRELFQRAGCELSDDHTLIVIRRI